MTEPTELKPTQATDIEQVEDTDGLKQAATHEKAFAGHDVANEVANSQDEKRLLRKLDFTIVPLSGLIYFVAYLDRNSIGNARLMGLEEDLHLTAHQFYNCLTMFFVGYIVFMLPANVCLRAPHVSAPAVIGASVVLFGTFCAALGGSHNYATVLVLRILVGSAQAFIQGLGLYFTFWYKRNELASRSATLYSFATISGAFSGLIAYGVAKNLTKAASGLDPWRWLFIIEGLCAIAVGITTYLVFPRFADKINRRKNWLLNDRDIAVALQRSKGLNTVGANFTWMHILTTLQDPKSWLFACINAGVALGISSVGNFLPTFIRTFGYSPVRAQLFTVIPYACATLSTLAIGFSSDRWNMKGPFLILCLSTSCVGYVILLSVTNVPVLIFASCLITSGLYPSVILLTTWLGINTAGFTKRGTAWAMAEIFGQCFSIMGTHVYDSPPRFTKGHSIVLGFLAFAIICATCLILWMKWMNRSRENRIARYAEQGEPHPHMERSLEEEGDHHLQFRYIL